MKHTKVFTTKAEIKPVMPTKQEMRSAGKAADELESAFTWVFTKEGFLYWSQIYTRLRNISEGAEL